MMPPIRRYANDLVVIGGKTIEAVAEAGNQGVKGAAWTLH
jgi:hypothetical protein